MARISTLKFWFSIIAGLGVVVLGLLAIVILPDVQVWLKIICCVIAVISGFALVAFGLAQRREDSIRENNEGFRDRLLNRMHDRMFSSETAVVSTKEKNQLQLEVNEADPRVYVEVLDQRETLYAKTVFLLHNRGQDVAHRVQIQPLKLNCGEATFPSVEVLGQDEEKPVVPEIEKITPIWRHDISRILLKEWDHAGDISVLEFIRPMSITYEDYNSKRKWETTFDLVYHAVQDILERDWKLSEKPELLQVRNIKFKPLFS